jgi:predicted nucleic acid-binding protein
LPDFFIGGHASALGVPILTRDVARYRSYFPEVRVLKPN